MQSDADKRNKYLICQRQIKAQMGVKLSAFFDKVRSVIWQHCKCQNHHLDRPRIWLGVVSTVFDRALWGRGMWRKCT
jgi:hypothetical protein